MNTIKLNTIGEGPAKPKTQEGGVSGGELIYGPAIMWENGTEQFSVLVKVIDDTGLVGVIPSYMCSNLPETITKVAYAINPSLKLLNFSNESSGLETVEDTLLGPLERSLMTEAEFYDETVFGVYMWAVTGSKSDYRVVHCEKEMLWSEWVASDYNILGLIVNDANEVVYHTTDGQGYFYLVISIDSTQIKGDDAVDPRVKYILRTR